MPLARLVQYLLDNALGLATNLAIRAKDLVYDGLFNIVIPFEEDADIDDEMLETANRAAVWIKNAMYNALYPPPSNSAGFEDPTVQLAEDMAQVAAHKAGEGSPWHHFPYFSRVFPPVHRWLVPAESPAGSGSPQDASYPRLSVQQCAIIGVALTLVFLLAKNLPRPAPAKLKEIVAQEPATLQLPLNFKAEVEFDAQAAGPLPQEVLQARSRTPFSPSCTYLRPVPLDDPSPPTALLIAPPETRSAVVILAEDPTTPITHLAPGAKVETNEAALQPAPCAFPADTGPSAALFGQGPPGNTSLSDPLSVESPVIASAPSKPKIQSAAVLAKDHVTPVEHPALGVNGELYAQDDAPSPQQALQPVPRALPATSLDTAPSLGPGPFGNPSLSNSPPVESPANASAGRVAHEHGTPTQPTSVPGDSQLAPQMDPAEAVPLPQSDTHVEDSSSLPTTPCFTSPEITAASTPRRPLPRTMQLARRLLQMGARDVASAAEVRVLEKWARVGARAGEPSPQKGGRGQSRGKENEAPRHTGVEELVAEKTKMWRGTRWGA
ncbi:hypothetical protein B0H15DRAFT_970806 [Mycena belliarum]|uniref:Uncharacterized protein n=1 Tax=Mycena belliarum TaxID=1033014 RepID=A0AAD6U956_9AGAR|nr:hypothetical protein B0H15DRAFT_970806 [Mycena belliae]